MMKKKLITAIACLLVTIVFNFALPRLMPGDTVLMLVGMDEDLVTANEYAYYLEKTGADKPLLSQFGDYLSDILRGDLGYSYHHNAAISSLIKARLPATLQIAIPAVLLSSLLALILGSLMGIRKGSHAETALTSVQILADAVPSFLVGLLLIALFSFKLRWLPSGSLSSIRPPEGVFPALGDRIKHLVLPVLTITLGAVPAKYLMVCNTVSKQRDEKYVLFAKSRGLSKNVVVFRHILPNICQPFVTMVGMSVGFIVSGSLVIENIFSIKGMGSLMAQAITARDYPVLQGCLFVSAAVIVAANLLTDFLCLALDAKVRCKVHDAQ